MPRQPSLKTLMDGLDLDREQAVKVRKILKAESVEEIEDHPAVANLIRQCYRPPSLGRAQGVALDKELDGHGFEAIKTDRYDADPQYEYVNMGDSYCATLILNRYSGCWQVSSWGDLVERKNL